VVRRKHPEKWRTSSWFLLQDNAPAQWSILAVDFSAKNNVTTLQLPLYSPDLAPSEFCLFPQMKSALMVQHFYDATDIIKNMTEELKRLSQMASRNVSNTFTVTGRSI
jgi:transposase